MQRKKMLPVGVEDFRDIIQGNFYYVDKTRLLEKLLETGGKVNLFTRPRRFGKSLNISMMKHFFDIGGTGNLFDGLYISAKQELCDQYMGQFPVISISLKGICGKDFEQAKALMTRMINEAAREMQYLLKSERLGEYDLELYRSLMSVRMDETALVYSLRELTELLYRHYGKKVVVLIDEYDVPLAKANEQGYYEDMVRLLRNMFESVLKTNSNLQMAVMTGCLRVAKESIFTGLNNFRVYSITDASFDEYFGFTDDEVKEMLHYYELDRHYAVVKEWYDGYRFGVTDVYCPWDVICYCDEHRDHRKKAPQNYWLNTSGNDVIRYFIEHMGQEKEVARSELEVLINGGCVQKEIHEDLTYKELYESSENIWSILFMTGYLTTRGEKDGQRYDLVIPNQEICDIITTHILTLFKETVRKDGELLNAFCSALRAGEAELVKNIFTEYLQKTISIRDTFVRNDMKENFYHGILLGILGFKTDWNVRSNREAGDGFSDISITMDDVDIGIVIEIKYGEADNLERESKKALDQIHDKHYTEQMKQEGIKSVLKYGIACNRKQCSVAVVRENI